MDSYLTKINSIEDKALEARLQMETDDLDRMIRNGLRFVSENSIPEKEIPELVRYYSEQAKRLGCAVLWYLDERLRPYVKSHREVIVSISSKGEVFSRGTYDCHKPPYMPMW